MSDDDDDDDGDDDGDVDDDGGDDDDSHDGYTVAGINYHHASHRPATRICEPTSKPGQCSVNRVLPPRTRLDREHATIWFGGRTGRHAR